MQKVDIEELKKQAFQPRTADEEAENSSDVRAIALEGGEEVFVEVKSKVEDPWEERLKAFENAIKPYRRSINVALAVFGATMAVIAGILLYNAYQQFKPAEPTPVVSNLPFPASVVFLAGGVLILAEVLCRMVSGTRKVRNGWKVLRCAAGSRCRGAANWKP